MERSKEPLRVGVVGTGSLGFHHTRILRTLPDVRMEGFYEVRPERARQVLGVHGEALLGAGRAGMSDGHARELSEA